ncbi:MAG: GIY-YIG nuclease family protein [Anaerolineae bacterium]|nr:GIY-YIG nuclease family protein [Anaerolineae bacterium]
MAAAKSISLSGVYKITCTTNGKFYIGSSNNVIRRLKDHIYALNRGRHDNQYLQHAWDLHGGAAFEFCVIEACNTQSLLEAEQTWMDTLDACNRSVGYNIGIFAASGMRGRKASAETKEKQSRIRQGRKPSPESVAKTALGLMGHECFAETREKISRAKKGRKVSPAFRAHLQSISKGRRFTQQHRDRIGAANRRRDPEVYRRVSDAVAHDYLLTDPQGNVYQVHGLKQFCDTHGLNYTNVSCHSVSGKPYKGWKCQRLPI